MHRDPKRDAQIVEDEGLTAQPQGAPSVANPDLREQNIEAAVRAEENLKREAAHAIKATAPKDNEKEKDKEPAKKTPQVSSPNLSSLDKLDRERAAGEGMPPPSTN